MEPPLIVVINQVVRFRTRLVFVVAHMSHFGILYSLNSFTVVKVSCSLTYCVYHVPSSYHSTRAILLFLSILFGSQIIFIPELQYVLLILQYVMSSSRHAKLFNRKPLICGIPFWLMLKSFFGAA